MKRITSTLVTATMNIMASPSYSATAVTFEECKEGDLWCLERNHQLGCANPSTATLDTCLDWLERLHQQSNRGAKDIFLKIGQANEALAFHANSPELAKQYRALAAETYRGMIARDKADANAALALAGMTEDRSERLRLLRKGIALVPNDISALQLIASELVLTRRATDKLEAAQFMERAYLAQTGPNRWYLASMAHRIYLDAGAEEVAAEFLQRVRVDFGIEQFSSASMSRDPNDLTKELAALCNYLAVPVVGAGKCLESIDVTTRFLVSAEASATLQALADAAANAMHSITGAERQLASERPEWLKTFHEQLESLLARGYRSASVYLVYAWLTTGDKKLDAIQKAIALDPDNGQAVFALGEVYARRKMWDQALIEYRKAAPMLPPWQRLTLEEHIEVAEGFLRESADAKP